jgi:hypothetical protein
MTAIELRQLLQRDLARVVDQLIGLARSAVFISVTPTDEDRISIGASKMGGRPDLPTRSRRSIASGCSPRVASSLSSTRQTESRFTPHAGAYPRTRALRSFPGASSPGDGGCFFTS